MYSIVVYIPETHLEEVKSAMFGAGAGRLGNYDSCCWQTKGQGQFRPLENSSPYLGKKGEVESVVEWKVEMVCEREKIGDVVSAMAQAHPYETPAYVVVETLKIV